MNALRRTPAGVINIPPWDGIPKECAEVWALQKGQRIARCSFWTHPTRGGEARLMVDGELNRSSVAMDGRTLLELALDWREQFQGKGWTWSRDRQY